MNPELQSIAAFSVYKHKSQDKKVKKRRKHGMEKTQKVPKQEKTPKIKRKIDTSPVLESSVNHNGYEGEISVSKKKKKRFETKLNSSKILSFNGSEASDGDSIDSDNPLRDSQKLFKWTIDPIPPEIFFKEYWEKKALHIKRGNSNYYSHILNSSSLDKILRNNNLHYTRNVDVVCYENGVKEVYNQDGRATPSALWDYYSNGCSIRILNPQTYSHKVHLLLATLQEYFGSMVGANVYLTPPGSQGFAPHYDDIEAFIIQLEGRKHWKLYQPKGSDVLARFSSPNLSREEIGDPFMELTLKAGEMLYFPRGTIHEGSTDSEAHSLHITVSVYQRTSYADLLTEILPVALKKAADDEIEFRKGLPLDYLKHFGAACDSSDQMFRESVCKKVRSLMRDLEKYLDVDAGADVLGRKFIRDSMPPVLSKFEAGRSSKGDGLFLEEGEVVNRVKIDLQTRIRLLRFYCIRLVREDSTPKLYYNTENANVYHGEDEQWLELEENMIPAIKMLQNSYPSYTEVDSLPIEDEELKMQLISHLWEHGLIVSERALDTE